MEFPTFPRKHICLGITLLTSFGYGFAQQAAMATNPSGNPYFQSIVLSTGKKQAMDFSVRAVGSVKGRVFNDTSPAGTADSEGIAGVRVTLRSRDAGFTHFVLEQFTDENGIYEFQDLRPGKYTIEIDPADLPIGFRIQAKDNSPLRIEIFQSTDADIAPPAQRAIMGIVFIDKDGDARYKTGKDAPVEGALITVGGNLSVSDSRGSYTLRNLPAGRIALLVRSAKKAENTHVLLDLGSGLAANRVVNIPIVR